MHLCFLSEKDPLLLMHLKDGRVLLELLCYPVFVCGLENVVNGLY